MLTFQRMDSLLLGSLVNTAEIIPKVWVSTSSKQNLHHAGRNQKEKSVKSRKGRGSRGPDSEACLEIGSASAPVSGTAGKNINAVNVKDNGRETGSENLLAEALDKLFNTSQRLSFHNYKIQSVYSTIICQVLTILQSLF